MLRTDLSSAPSELYVPGAAIALGKDSLDMQLEHGLAFTQVELDFQLSVGATFRFTIPRAFDPQRRDFFTPFGDPLLPLLKLGTHVWIRMGYSDVRSREPLFSGYITTVSTSFAEGGAPDLEVAGQDVTYLMTLGTKEHRIDKGVPAAVNEVAQQNNISLKLADNPPSNVTLDSNLEKDLEFLGKVAQSFSKQDKKWEFFVRAKRGQDELYFRPRSNKAKPLVKLSWGADLLSFKPDLNLGDQVQKVVVLGWDELNKKEIRGEAVAQKGAPGERTGGEIQQSAFGRETVHQIKLPVKSKEEADQRAAAALVNKTDRLLKGEGETFGLPELLPDTVVELTGLGDQFNGEYYVTKTVHKYDTSGYRTRFSVENGSA